MYIYIYMHTYLYTSWQSQIKETIFFFFFENQWNEL